MLHEDIASIPFRSQLPEGGDPDFKASRAAQEFRFLDLLCTVLSRHLAAGDRLKAEELAWQTQQLIWLAVTDFFGLYYTKGRYWYISDYQLSRFNRTVRYIDENFQSKISVSDILAREYISRTYFSQFWAKFSSQSFSEFLLMRRLVIAESILLGTNLNLEEVSKSAGFSAVRYYYKYFVKCYRCKPLEYKARCQAYQKTAIRGEPLELWQAQAVLHDFLNRQVEPRKGLRRVLDPNGCIDFYLDARGRSGQRPQRSAESGPRQEILTIELTGNKNVLPLHDGGHRLNIDRICELLTLAESIRMTPHIRISYAVLQKRALTEELFVLLDKLEEIYGVQRLKNWQYFLLCSRLHAHAEEGDYVRRLRDRLGVNPVYIALEI